MTTTFRTHWMIRLRGSEGTHGRHETSTEVEARTFLVDLLNKTTEQEAVDPDAWEAMLLITEESPGRGALLRRWEGTLTHVIADMISDGLPAGSERL